MIAATVSEYLDGRPILVLGFCVVVGGFMLSGGLIACRMSVVYGACSLVVYKVLDKRANGPYKEVLDHRM